MSNEFNSANMPDGSFERDARYITTRITADGLMGIQSKLVDSVLRSPGRARGRTGP